MTARIPVVLAVVVVLLLGYIYFFERDRPGRADIESRSGLLLEPLLPERVTRVRIASGGDRTAMFREGEGFDETWTIEEPVEAPGDIERIYDYLREWEFAIPVRTLESPTAQDVERFGLDRPKAQVKFEMGRTSVRVTLGAGTPIDGGGYVRVDDHERVAVVSSDVVTLFQRDAEYFRVKNDAGAPDLDDLLGDDEGPEAAEEEAGVPAP